MWCANIEHWRRADQDTEQIPDRCVEIASVSEFQSTFLLVFYVSNPQNKYTINEVEGTERGESKFIKKLDPILYNFILERDGLFGSPSIVLHWLSAHPQLREIHPKQAAWKFRRELLTIFCVSQLLAPKISTLILHTKWRFKIHSFPFSHFSGCLASGMCVGGLFERTKPIVLGQFWIAHFIYCGLRLKQRRQCVALKTFWNTQDTQHEDWFISNQCRKFDDNHHMYLNSLI